MRAGFRSWAAANVRNATFARGKSKESAIEAPVLDRLSDVGDADGRLTGKVFSRPFVTQVVPLKAFIPRPTTRTTSCIIRMSLIS